MAKLYEISEWNEQPWWSTGGTRNKKIYLNPDDNELYYFKQSFKQKEKDYKYEFWSEIIAYELGSRLNFNVLPYHIAIRDQQIGCISKSMINQTSEELVEGGKYLQAFDNTFDPEDVKLRHQYSFELILKTFKFFKLDNYIKDIVDIIVFDALIGNSDRHQENWAVINTHSAFSETLTELEQEVKKDSNSSISFFWNKILKFLYTNRNGELRTEIKKAKLLTVKETRFAPIYDSGCCFGRELLDDKVKQLLNETSELEKYVLKGEAEIHWGDQKKKLKHFQLLENLLELSEIKPLVINSLGKVVANYDQIQISEMVSNIDFELIDYNSKNQLPEERKQLIVNLLHLRYKRLQIIYDKYK